MATIDQLGQQAGADLRDEVEATTDVEVLLARFGVEAGAPTARPHHLGWRVALVAAAVVAVIGGLLATSLWSPDATQPVWHDTTQPATTVTSVPTTTSTPQTSAPQTSEPTSSTASTEPAVSSTVTSSTVALPEPVQPAAGFNRVLDMSPAPNWSSPIDGPRCEDRYTCPSFAAGGDGGLVMFDPTRGVLDLGWDQSGRRREVSVPFTRPASASLITIGPDDVAYFARYSGGGPADELGDIVAVPTTGDRAGTVVAEVNGVLDPSGDTDWVPARPGVVAVGCCDQAPVVPKPDAELLMRWVDGRGAPRGDSDRSFVTFARIDGGIEVHRADATGDGQTWRIADDGVWRGMPSAAVDHNGEVRAAWMDMIDSRDRIYRFKTNGEVDRIDPGERTVAGIVGPNTALLWEDGRHSQWFLPAYTTAGDATTELAQLAGGPASSVDPLIDRLTAAWSATTCENPSSVRHTIVSNEPMVVVFDVRESCDDSVGGARYNVTFTGPGGDDWHVEQATRRWLCIRGGGDVCT